MVDDLRTKSFIYEGDTIQLDDVEIFNFSDESPAPYKVITLVESRSKGVLYCIGDSRNKETNFKNSKGESCSLSMQNLIPLLAPKGFHVSNNDDLADLEKYYGVETPSIVEFSSGYFPLGYLNEDNYDFLRKYYAGDFQGSNVDLRRRLSSMYDWKYYNGEETAVGMQTEFNAKPFAAEDNGTGCIYYTLMDENHSYTVGLLRILSTVDRGILNMGCDLYWQGGYRYAQIRCVKD